MGVELSNGGYIVLGIIIFLIGIIFLSWLWAFIDGIFKISEKKEEKRSRKREIEITRYQDETGLPSMKGRTHLP